MHTGAELAQPGDPTGVHLPAPSYWPIALAASMPLIGYGVIFNLWLALPGVILMMMSLWGWALEPADDLDPSDGHDDHAGPETSGLGPELEKIS